MIGLPDHPGLSHASRYVTGGANTRTRVPGPGALSMSSVAAWRAARSYNECPAEGIGIGVFSDDQAALRMLLSLENDLDVVGEAEDGAAVLGKHEGDEALLSAIRNAKG